MLPPCVTNRVHGSWDEPALRHPGAHVHVGRHCAEILRLAPPAQAEHEVPCGVTVHRREELSDHPGRGREKGPEAGVDDPTPGVAGGAIQHARQLLVQAAGPPRPPSRCPGRGDPRSARRTAACVGARTRGRACSARGASGRVKGISHWPKSVSAIEVDAALPRRLTEQRHPGHSRRAARAGRRRRVPRRARSSHHSRPTVTG